MTPTPGYGFRGSMAPLPPRPRFDERRCDERVLDGRLRSMIAPSALRGAGPGPGDPVQRHLGAYRATADLPWIDLDAQGRTVRAGITALDDLTIRIAADLHEHPDLIGLAGAAAGSLPVGQVLSAAAGDRLYWYAPAPPGAGRVAGGAVLRGLAVSLPVFAALVERFDADRHVTAAEKRTLFQLVAGLAPRDAAAADRVSVETKRAQLKSLCAKLDCGGQTALVRRTVGQLVHLLHLT